MSKRKKSPKIKPDKRLRRKKWLMRLIILVCFILSLVSSIYICLDRAFNTIVPQIARAMVQVATVLPQLESNENSLREVYEQMKASREALTGQEIEESDEGIQKILEGPLSWMERITGFKVGRDGYVMIVSKADGTILAHPDDDMVGTKLGSIFSVATPEGETMSEFQGQADLSIENIGPDASVEDLIINYHVIFPLEAQDKQDLNSKLRMLRSITLGCVASYRDTYIICGIGTVEFLGYVFEGVLISLILFVLMWLFAKYVRYHLEYLGESAKSLRPKLFAFSVIISVALFGVSWYTQILSETTNDLKTMGMHANVAVETLNDYRELRSQINSWLDEQYLIQCRLAAEQIAAADRSQLTRADMKALADTLGVEQLYLFDKEGRVVVTNSPYDHFVLSEDPQDQSYAFRPLLEGADHVVQQPLENDVFQETMQYIGVSIRDENDLCDGFVQIGANPALRERLIVPFHVKTVLSNLVIGLPQHAVAIDKDTLLITDTTGIGFPGQSAAEMGISAEGISENRSGFLRIGGRDYYAGFSESADLYLVPIVPRTRDSGTILSSAILGAISFAGFLLILFTALHRYDDMKAEADEKAAAAENAEADAVPPGGAVEEYGLFSGFTSLIKTRDKYNFEGRWNMKAPESSKLSPEARIRRPIYWVMLIFCLINLLPVLWCRMLGSDPEKLNGLAYVITGNWEKGLNIFAFSACVFLLFALYIFIVLTDRILYHIARISDTRVETICLLIRSSLKYVCAILFIYYGLSKFGIATQTLLASAGILSLVIGLGAKDLVNDIIAGFFIIFEGTFKVGDYVTIGGFFGEVTQIGIRTTKVTFYSDTKIFNNSSIRDIINSDGKVAREVVSFPISYSTNLLEIEEILKKELPAISETIPSLTKPLRYDYLDAIQEHALLLRISVFASPGMRRVAKRSTMRGIKLMLDKYGIEMPYSGVAVHYLDGEEKKQGPEENP